MELDDTLGEAHTSRAVILAMYDWDYAGAEKEFRRGIELSPSNSNGHHFFGIVLLHEGRFDEALSEEKRAVELDPISPVASRAVGAVLGYQRKYDESIGQLKKTLELAPNFGLALNDLGFVYLEKGMYAEANAEFEKSVAMPISKAAPLSSLAYAYAVEGRKADAQKILDQLNDLSKREYIQPRLLARVYAGLGDKEKTFEYLERSYADRSIETGFATINVDHKALTCYARTRVTPTSCTG